MIAERTTSWGRQRGAISTAQLALLAASIALAIALYVLFTCCEKPAPPKKDDGGPGTKVVRIKNESGSSINKGLKMEASAEDDGMPADDRWPIGAPFAKPIPHNNDPGELGSVFPSSDPGYKKIGYTPPPKSRTWVLTATLEDGTELKDVVFRTPAPQTGVHIQEVLARLVVREEANGDRFYRFNYDVIFWKQIGYPGSWVAQPALMDQDTAEIPAATN